LTPEERHLGRGGMAKRYMAGPLELAKGSEDSLSVKQVPNIEILQECDVTGFVGQVQHQMRGRWL
jgi:hypothetical protein